MARTNRRKTDVAREQALPYVFIDRAPSLSIARPNIYIWDSIEIEESGLWQDTVEYEIRVIKDVFLLLEVSRRTYDKGTRNLTCSPACSVEWESGELSVEIIPFVNQESTILSIEDDSEDIPGFDLRCCVFEFLTMNNISYNIEEWKYACLTGSDQFEKLDEKMISAPTSRSILKHKNIYCDVLILCLGDEHEIFKRHAKILFR